MVVAVAGICHFVCAPAGGINERNKLKRIEICRDMSNLDSLDGNAP